MTDGLLAVGLLAVLVWALTWLQRRQRRAAVRLEALHRGLSGASADFVVELLGGDGPEAARALLRTPDHLRQRLAAELGAQRSPDATTRFALRASLLADEMRMRPLPFPGAPVLFEALELVDPVDAASASVTGYVVHVDERNVSFVSTDACPWPVRRDLVARRLGADADALPVMLFQGPLPGSREWVVGHHLVEHHEENVTGRATCSVPAWALPCTAGTYSLRTRLQGGETLDPSSLVRLEAWPRRLRVVVEDLSSDGARMACDQPLARGDRFYLMLPHPDGPVAALPLAEVVSVREGEGRFVLSTRFCAVRLKERMLLADYAHEATRLQSASRG